MNKKRLTIENRLLIEQLLKLNYSLQSIANILEVYPSTISREIKKRRVTGKGNFKGCNKLNRFHFICDGCPNKTYCRKKNIIKIILKHKVIMTVCLKIQELG